MPNQTVPSSTESPDIPKLSAVRVVEKHPAAIRWMHWINFPLLLLMIYSGFRIYWADSIPGHGGKHQVYRIGVGSFTLFRFFPDGFYKVFVLGHHFPQGLGMHALGMWLFTANGVAYAVFLLVSGQWRAIVPGRRALSELAGAVRAELTGRHGGRDGSKYNPAQRVAYTLIVLMGVGAVITGAAIWKPTSLHWITALCGGYQAARWLHFWLTIGFCLFFFVHVAQVLRAGWNNLRSMITGAELSVAERAAVTASGPDIGPLLTPSVAAQPGGGLHE